jgi:hypothetical protein
MPDWLDYQKLAAAIYDDLAHGAVVTHNDKILGRITGLMRQIDVSIRTTLVVARQVGAVLAARVAGADHESAAMQVIHDSALLPVRPGGGGPKIEE